MFAYWMIAVSGVSTVTMLDFGETSPLLGECAA